MAPDYHPSFCTQVSKFLCFMVGKSQFGGKRNRLQEEEETEGWLWLAMHKEARQNDGKQEEWMRLCNHHQNIMFILYMYICTKRKDTYVPILEGREKKKRIGSSEETDVKEYNWRNEREWLESEGIPPLKHYTLHHGQYCTHPSRDNNRKRLCTVTPKSLCDFSSQLSFSPSHFYLAILYRSYTLGCEWMILAEWTQTLEWSMYCLACIITRMLVRRSKISHKASLVCMFYYVLQYFILFKWLADRKVLHINERILAVIEHVSNPRQVY